MTNPRSGPIANYSRQQYIKVKEKEEAWKKYKDAVEEGKTAGSGGFDKCFALICVLLLVGLLLQSCRCSGNDLKHIFSSKIPNS